MVSEKMVPLPKKKPGGIAWAILKLSTLLLEDTKSAFTIEAF
jgi:hypothetical protein